ncbi:MAG: cobyric acid synthase [bacterium]|nr:cobyric acid synthase [bacterium]
MAKAIMIQGTASNAGKSILNAALCRIFFEDGLSVAPFKAQNMSLNSFVTEEGLEMGRAQVTQARACRLKPNVNMNPILLKPSSEKGAQVIVMGKPAGHMTVESYTAFKKRLRTVVRESYDYLRARYDVIVIEGAGSPAEVNLKKDDLTNMHVAKLAQCPVLIVGDIDKGGVYAHLIGTYDLLDKEEQALTAGFIINKFRGEQSMLEPANAFLEERTKKKLFGVVPMIRDLQLPDEDSVEFKQKVDKNRNFKSDTINILLVDLPHISNFTDFDPLATIPNVNLHPGTDPADLEQADMIILPGSKNTLKDLEYLKQKGFREPLNKAVAAGKMVVGICGGYQMLGRSIRDPLAVETMGQESAGFGFLDMTTDMVKEKRLTQLTAICSENDLPVQGYEIHHGRSAGKETPYFRDKKYPGEILGCRRGNVWGTYIHGVFDGAPFRNHILNELRQKKKLPQPTGSYTIDIDAELTRLASIVRPALDMKAIYQCLGIFF